MADKIRVKSNFDMKGNYEPSDSEEEYSPKEKKLLDKLRKRKHESESEEEMYAFSESDDDSDAKKDDMGMADSDVEGQEKSDDDLPDSKAWGKKKKSYYATDYVDEDYGGFGDDEEAALMEEQEAKNIQKRLLEQLGEEDFTLDFFTKQAAKIADGEEKDTVIKSDLTQMSKRQKLQLFEKESPEFAGLIDDFKSKLTVAKDDLHPVVELVKDGKLPECPTSKLVTTKYNLILNYCTNISFYLLLKSQRVNIQNHPVVMRLYMYRQMLNKLEPLYQEVVKPQLDNILDAVRNNVPIIMEQSEKKKLKESKKQKSKKSLEPSSKKLKLITDLEKDDSDDTGVSNDEENYDGNDFFDTDKVDIQRSNEESEESGFSDNDANNDPETENEIFMQPSTSQAVVAEEMGDKREITYQIAKNKGLTPHRKKEQRNPRVKHKLKFRKAKIRRKGAIREPRTEVSRYGGEASGIKANVKKSIKIK